jgi:addiction module RelE/StbE family toxin
MKVTFAPRAVRDLDAISAFIARENPRAASRVIARIDELTSRLGEHPGMGRETELPPTRVFPVPDFPYLIFYAARGDGEVRILRVRHAARQRRRP